MLAAQRKVHENLLHQALTIVERAIDALASQTRAAAVPGRMAALLAQMDRVPDRADAYDPLEWDGAGLPK